MQRVAHTRRAVFEAEGHQANVAAARVNVANAYFRHLIDEIAVRHIGQWRRTEIVDVVAPLLRPRHTIQFAHVAITRDTEHALDTVVADEVEQLVAFGLIDSPGIAVELGFGEATTRDKHLE